MITLKYEVWNDSSSVKEINTIFAKDFSNERDMYDWIKLQDAHPFLYIKVLETIIAP